MINKYIKISLLMFIALHSWSVFSKDSDNQVIDKLVSNYIKAYENRDVQTIVKLYAPDALAIGTGADEKLTGRKAIEAGFNRDFAQSSEATITLKKIASYIQKDFAVASYYAIVNVVIPKSKPFKSKLRFTLALTKKQNQWLIQQSHLSAPLANEKVGESFPKGQ